MSSKDNNIVKQPYYKGGSKELAKFIQKNIKYPKKALASKTEGIVQIRIEISHKGKVSSSKLISDIGNGCGKEAQRVVKLLQFVIPKEPRKMRLTFHKTLRIPFKIPKEKKIKQSGYTYHTSPKSEQKEKANPKTNSSYSYTIKW